MSPLAIAMIVFAVIMLIMVILISVHMFNDEEDPGEGVFVFLLIGVFVCVSFPAISIPLFGKQYEQSKICDIYSIRGPEGEVEGHFALGWGTIKTEQYYFFYVKKTDSDGMEYFTYEKSEADETRLVETDATSPSLWCIKDVSDEYKVMYVPNGTIRVEFSI